MSYSIYSKNFNNPFLKDLLKKLRDYFDTKDLPFFIIGATARDIIVGQLFNSESIRRTVDLDIAIAIPDWNKFDEISDELSQLPGFRKSREQQQRFFFNEYELDIVPFGGVAKSDDNIYWPPEEESAMSVRGFNEALAEAITVNVDKEFTVMIASLYGLFLLKFTAWIDRSQKTTKDAEDMTFIIKNYFEVNSGRKIHQEVYDRDDFDTYLVGGIWLAYDIAHMLSVPQVKYYNTIIKEEIEKNEASLLVNQMYEHSGGLSFDIIHQTWQEISGIFDNCVKQASSFKDEM